MLKKQNCSGIVVWSENGFNEQIVIGVSKKLKIPVILLQHGIYADDPKANEQNKFSGLLPLKSDKFAVWGKAMSDYAKNYGIDTEKIEQFRSTKSLSFEVGDHKQIAVKVIDLRGNEVIAVRKL